MSIDAGIHMTVEPGSSDWPVRFLNSLLSAGWEMNDHGKIVILPLGDDDAFDWCEHRPETGDVWDVFRSKLEAEEPLGVALTWQQTQSGGMFLFSPSGVVTFTPSINRRRLDDSDVSDVSWYLPKLLGAFSISGTRLASWSWVETR